MRLRSWVVWVVTPSLILVLSVTVLFWQPIPAEKDFGQELLVDGQRVALPLQVMKIGMLLDGGSAIYTFKDANGEVHQVACRYPTFREVWHLRGSNPSEGGGYGHLVVEDGDLRNLVYHSANRLRAAGNWHDRMMLGLLYPSLFHRWFIAKQ